MYLVNRNRFKYWFDINIMDDDVILTNIKTMVITYNSTKQFLIPVMIINLKTKSSRHIIYKQL